MLAGNLPAQVANQGVLERGHIRIELIHFLAEAVHTQLELAQMYGVRQPAISTFAKRHATEIAAAKSVLDNEFTGLWIADKRARIAEYQQDIEDINDELPDIKHPSDKAAMRRVKHTATRSVAEELAQLPARTMIQVNQQTVHYNIDGVDMDQL